MFQYFEMDLISFLCQDRFFIWILKSQFILKTVILENGDLRVLIIYLCHVTYKRPIYCWDKSNTSRIIMKWKVNGQHKLNEKGSFVR